MQKALPTTSYWPEEPPSWPRRNRHALWVVLASLLVHLSVALTLSRVAERHRDADKLRAISPSALEFEVVTRPETPPPAPGAKPPARSRPIEKAAMPPKPAEKAVKIVELPAAPEEKPDAANYLAERDMRADKETIAKKIGAPENRTQPGVVNGQTSDAAEARPQVEAQAKIEQRDGSAGPAAAGEGTALRDEAAEAGGDELVAEADGIGRTAGLPRLAPGARAGGGGRTGAPGMRGSDPLLPSPQRLARLIEPSQRNILQAQHGDITLLNARSSELATYIISRAKRIYSFLTINGPLLTVFYEDVENLQFPIAIEAAINRRGEIVKLATIASSGSMKIDRLVSEATRSGLQSDAPPPDEGFADEEAMRFRFALYNDHIEAGLP